VVWSGPAGCHILATTALFWPSAATLDVTGTVGGWSP
jgi:hypothetical protein